MKESVVVGIIHILLIGVICCGYYVEAYGTSPAVVTEATLHQVAGSLKMYVDKLPQMPHLYGYVVRDRPHHPNPLHLTLGMYHIQWKFHRDLPPSDVFAYGTSAVTATVPGPCIEALRGLPLTVTWQNHLPRSHIFPWDPTIPTAIPKRGGVPTVVHLHGGAQPSDVDGHALAWFTAGFHETGPTWSRRSYAYPNTQHAAGAMWYHDHAVGLTRVNLLAGLFGPYILRDPPLEAELNLPSGTEFDRVLMIFDRSFNRDGSLYMNRTGNNPGIHPQWRPEYFGDAVIVNGKAWPYLEVRRRKYRFRIINTSNARYFNLALTNGLSFTQVGSDGSYLPSPVNASTVLLAPAEVADVVVDFAMATGNESILTNDAPYPYPAGNPVDELNSKVMKFIMKPKRTHPKDTSTLPKTLPTYTLPSPHTPPAIQRYITMYEYQSPTTGNPTHLYINGKRFSDPVTETPRTGSTEVWEVINLTGDNHPLHIHLATFQAVRVQQLMDVLTFTRCMTLKYDAVACNVTAHATGPLVNVPDNEKTWKNIVKIAPGTMTTVVVKFNLVDRDEPYPFDATTGPGYVYHCHILDHEDNEMIRPLKLVR